MRQGCELTQAQDKTKLLRQEGNTVLGVTQNVSMAICWPTHVGFRCGWSSPSEQTLKEKPSEDQAIWLKGLSLAISRANSKFLPGNSQSFWKISCPSRRCGRNRSRCQQWGTSSRHSKHSSRHGRVCSRGKKLKWIQTWNRKWQVSDLERTVESRVLRLCYLKDLWGMSRIKSLYMEEVFGCLLGAFPLFIIKGLRKKNNDLTCLNVLWNLTQVHFACRFIAQKNWQSLRFFMLSKLKK